MSVGHDRPTFALVTGATGGVGRSICMMAAEAGYNVVVHFNNNQLAAREIVEAAESRGVRATSVQADLSDSLSYEVIAAHVEDALRCAAGDASLGLLVNNAAKMLGPSLQDARVEEFDEYFAINARAPFFLAQRLLPTMTPGGCIVNVSSASAHFSSPGDIVYAMSKAAVESMTRNMAEAIAPYGVRVNAVIPGFTDNGHPAFSDPLVKDYMSSFAVLGGVSRPEDVAAAILFLASPEAARTTGSLLDVSGGSTLAARGSRHHSVKGLLA